MLDQPMLFQKLTHTCGCSNTLSLFIRTTSHISFPLDLVHLKFTPHVPKGKAESGSFQNELLNDITIKYII